VKVYVYPADQHGCGMYRLIWPAKALAARGYDVTVVRPGDGSDLGLEAGIDINGRVVSVNYPPDADVIVMQRVAHRFLRQAVPFMRAQGVAVVVDMDDDLSNIHPANPAYHHFDPENVSEKSADYSWVTAQESCWDATMVTVSTEALIGRYAPHGRAVVLRNCVPESYLDVPHPDSARVGWGGSVASHPTDLQVMGDAVKRLVAWGHRFHLVGPPQGVDEVLGIGPADVFPTGVVKMVRWPFALTQLGIGVAPLARSVFNDAKSHLKILELSALGVPFVASPSPEYAGFATSQGVGLLARTPVEWFNHINTLIKDAGLRRRMSAAGRDVAARWTIEGNCTAWWEAWQLAYQLQHTPTAPGERLIIAAVRAPAG
jgi:glycosyltransferase involved in cell wall biosynthesis